jgi:hypothetical protein
MNFKALNLGFSIALVLLPVAAQANPTALHYNKHVALKHMVAVDTRWNPKTTGYTKDGYRIMRAFSQRSFVSK